MLSSHIRIRFRFFTEQNKYILQIIFRNLFFRFSLQRTVTDVIPFNVFSSFYQLAASIDGKGNVFLFKKSSYRAKNGFFSFRICIKFLAFFKNNFSACNILLKNTQGIRRTASVQQLCRVKVLLTLQYFQMDMRLLGAFVGNAACTAKYLAF